MEALERDDEQEDVCDAGDRRAAGAADRRLHDLLPDEGIRRSRSNPTPRSARPPTSRANLSSSARAHRAIEQPSPSRSPSSLSRRRPMPRRRDRPRRHHRSACATGCPDRGAEDGRCRRTGAGCRRCSRNVAAGRSRWRSRRARSRPAMSPGWLPAASPRDGRAQGMAELEADRRELSTAPAPAPADQPVLQEENRDRVEEFKTNPVHATAEDPVSTFSIDVDTASYSFVRAFAEGRLPAAGRYGPRRGDDQLLPL